MPGPKPETLPSFYVPDEPEAPDWTPPPWPDDCPAPGIYEGVPYEHYAAWPAVTRNILQLVYEVTPKHAKAAIDGELPDTDSKDRRFGRAEHCRLLEPDVFAERFLIASPCAEPLKSGKRKGEPCGCAGVYYRGGFWFCGKHRPDGAQEPRDYLSADQATAIERVKDAVFGHKVVRILRTHGGCEVSVVWNRDGLPCKARLDKMIHKANCPNTVLDLKKIQATQGTDHALRRAIRNYSYDIQAAWYTEGVKAVTGDPFRFAWVFTEDAPPFDVRPLWASPAMLEVGRCKVNAAWQTYLRCVQSGEWPGYCDDIEEIAPEPWEMKRYGIE
jgi:hypothetical protein